MKRIRRWVSWITVSASLILCGLAIIAWGRSYFANEDISWFWRTSGPMFVVGRGLVFSQVDGCISIGAGVVQDRVGEYSFSERHWRISSYGFLTPRSDESIRTIFTNLYRFHFEHEPLRPPRVTVTSGIRLNTWLIFPHWPLAVCFAAVPLLRWLKIRRQVAAGNCLICGYDLRGTPDRCPECGTVPEALPDGTA